jgi:hypothetical protein
VISRILLKKDYYARNGSKGEKEKLDKLKKKKYEYKNVEDQFQCEVCKVNLSSKGLFRKHNT